MSSRTPRLLRDSDALRAAMAARAAEEQSAREVFIAAADWAIAHVAAEGDVAGYVIDTGMMLPLAGPGAPEVQEHAVTEFVTAIGMRQQTGSLFVGQALEACVRLPRVWARLLRGELAVWQVRRIAEDTIPLSQEAAALVDARIAAYAHQVSRTQIGNICRLAQEQTDPGDAVLRKAREAEHRRFDVWLGQTGFDGTVDVSAILDQPDAADLERAIAALAEQLKKAGSEETLSVRRAKAAGMLARGEKALPLETGGGSEGAAASATQPRPRHLTLYVHLSVDAVTGALGDVARSEASRSPIAIDVIRSWCQTAGTSVTVRPILDVAAERYSDTYEVPDLIREQIILRDHTCVFPYCQRPARACDADHVRSYESGGPTASSNLAPLCRKHHRHKTHDGWRYKPAGPDEPGVYLWRSPNGVRFRRDRLGTTLTVIEPVETPPDLDGG
ncbi:HNH endonuclease [Nocardioides sp. TRM66260-LWL]|uniref:HNH endonuclease signature motif containing protein n=1 Tax=Nocardioides sp. TRM66260-LWL TaxID=2874478 RepID=UPI001CC4A153|nr:HNH endonuclease signature motif containing protein [Nocardioides sp. TRM66260-LWL]MBZ5733319.1 HNH endonuclease [Nocardioides sp. TRM66260-LWL]